MILGRRAIERAFRDNVWQAYENGLQLQYDRIRIGPNSVDVTLSNRILVPRPTGTSTCGFGSVVDPHDPACLEWHQQEIDWTDGFLLPPGAFVLGSVRERFQCSNPLKIDSVPYDDGNSTYTANGMRVPPPKAPPRMATFAPMYEGRSTMGRLGIASHITAGFGDYGFEGAFTLEIFNHLGIMFRLRHGMRIGQVVFQEVVEPGNYNGAYSGINHYDGPVAPVLGRERF